jgi:hypothetical protein
MQYVSCLALAAVMLAQSGVILRESFCHESFERRCDRKYIGPKASIYAWSRWLKVDFTASKSLDSDPKRLLLDRL